MMKAMSPKVSLPWKQAWLSSPVATKVSHMVHDVLRSPGQPLAANRRAPSSRALATQSRPSSAGEIAAMKGRNR